MQLLPFKFRNKISYQNIAKWIFIITNSLLIIMNCADTAFFRFTNRRTTSTIFTEFKNEENIGEIIYESIFEYWYIVLFAIVIITFLCIAYSKPSKENKSKNFGVFYYIYNTIILLVFVYFMVIGIRGGFGKFTRPITLSNANKYVNKSNETAIVLNTPFCILRTINKKIYKDPKYFKNQEEMEAIYSPIHFPKPEKEFKPLNVVVIIMESFGKEYTGYFNKKLDNCTYKGCTPFLDSLLAEGLTFEYSYSNGRKSIDAMPSVLSSIPMFIEPYIVTPYSTNDISSIASVLKEKGYYSAFFHGAPNGSMGFEAYAKAAGFEDYYGLNEYNNNEDFDGTWAIWDEEFFQFYAKKMGEMKQPFMTAMFTASSHHPYNIPERYKDKFAKGTMPIHKCISYSDNALRLFFKKMSEYSWYKNTLFVITADHTNSSCHKEYVTDEKLYAVPILFYKPDSDDLKGKEMRLAQQIDIMPSILGYLNYDKPYFAFGNDIISNKNNDNFVVNYNNQIYQIFQHDYFLQFDGEKTKAIYNFKTDTFLEKNLVGKVKEQEQMEKLLKSMIQQYIVRMTNNELQAKE